MHDAEHAGARPPGEVLSRASEGTYLLVDYGTAGRALEEGFPAPDDASAIQRAREVSAGRGELWQGGRLIARWDDRRLRGIAGN